jgi:hypothetical protein
MIVMNDLFFKELTVIDAYDIYVLQQEYADPNWFTLRDIYSIFFSCQNDRCIGLYDKKTLVAYSIFSYASQLDTKYLPLIHPNELVGKFSGTVVACSHKGNGIQKYFLDNHILYAKNNNVNYLMAYAHSENTVSIKNIKNMGLKLTGNFFIKHKNESRNIFFK